MNRNLNPAPTHSRTRLPLLSKLTAAAGLALCLLANTAQATPVATYGTGTLTPGLTPVLAPLNSTDAHFHRVLAPINGPGVTVGTATVIAPPSYLLSPNGPSSQWITDGALPAFQGTAYYETSFDMTGFNLATAILSGRFATGGPNARLFLNGNLLAGSFGSYGPSTPLAFSNFSALGSGGGLNGAMNYLVFAVDNTPSAVYQGLNALRVQYVVDAQQVPEPTTLALAGLALVGAGLARRRRQL